MALRDPIETAGSMWRDANFLKLFSVYVVSSVGSGIGKIALIWFAYDLTNSALAMGPIYACFHLPGALAGPFAGALADRISRARILIWVRLAQTVIILGYVVAHRLENIALLFVLVTLAGTLKAGFDAPFTAFVGDVVKSRYLASANAALMAGRMLSTALGALIATPLIAQGLVDIAFGVNSISLAVSGILLLLLSNAGKSGKRSHGSSVHVFRRMIDGLVLLVKTKEIQKLSFAVVIFTAVYSLPLAQLAPYCKNMLATTTGRDPGALLAVMESTLGIGAMLGVFIIASVINKIGSTATVILGAILGSVQWIAMAIIPQFFVLVLIVLFVSGASTFIAVPITTAIQKHDEQQAVGSIIGAFQALLLLSGSFAYAIGGFAVERWGIRDVMITDGAILAILAFIFATVLVIKSISRKTARLGDGYQR